MCANQRPGNDEGIDWSMDSMGNKVIVMVVGSETKLSKSRGRQAFVRSVAA